MQVEQVFIMWGSHPVSNAEIKVPGLGTVKIDNVLSDETRALIEKEAILALQMKLGLTCQNLKEASNGDTNIQGREDESTNEKTSGDENTTFKGKSFRSVDA